MSRRNKTVKTTDAFSNPVHQLGFGTQNPIESTQYPLTRMSQNYALLNSLYRSNWIVQNIIDTIPSDMTKKWFELTGSVSQEAKRRVDALMRSSRLRKSIGDGLKWGRLYGGAAGIILIKGQEQLEEPLNLDAIMPGTFAGLYVVDRWSGVYPESELVSDMTDPDFGLPAYYTVRDENDKDVQRVHHSRVIRFIGRELPYYERIAETYWGESELEAIYDEIAKRDNVSHNIASLTFRACRDYMEMDNVDQLFAIGGQQQQERFWRTMQAQAVLDTNFGMRVVNKGDAIHNTQYTFAGLADVYDGVMMDVAGAARIPVTKLFGRSPAGMNATGESDLQNYYDYIDEQRESRLRPIIERLLPVLALSAWGVVPDDLDIKFPPLWTPKAVELASIAAQKTQVVIDTFKAQLIDAGQAQAELKGLSDETGMFGGIEDETIKANRGKSFEQMNDPFAGLSLPSAEDTVSTRDGGPGSGNFNHAGRPGAVGGSGGGVAYPNDRQRKIDSIHIDFESDNMLPELNKEDLAELGKESKPVLLKREVLERNLLQHPEVPREEYDEIIKSALYSSDLRFKGKSERHNQDYVNFVKTVPHQNSLVLLQIAAHKENFEIIHLFKIGDRSLKRMQKR